MFYLNKSRYPENQNPRFHLQRALSLLELKKTIITYDKKTMDGRIEDLISYLEQEMAKNPQYIGLEISIKNLADSYVQASFLSDIQSAIKYPEKATAIVPTAKSNHAGLPSYLGGLLAWRYEQTGEINDLQLAIFRTEEALNAIPYDHPNRPGYLGNLGNWLGRKYERTGALDDLQSAIFQCNEAVKLTPSDDICRASRLSSLGNWLGRKYERTGAFADLEEAIYYAREALAITPARHGERPSYLNNYGIMLARKYLHNHDLLDIFRAIVCVQDALDDTPSESPSRIHWLSNLATIVAWKFQYTGLPDDLDYAIHRAYETLAAMPFDHPCRAFASISYGDLLNCRSKQPHATDEQKRRGYNDCLLCYQCAWQSHNSPPAVRIIAAYKAAKILMVIEKCDEAYTILRVLVELLPGLSPHNLTQQDRQYILREFTGVSTLAASVAFEIENEPVSALQLLEQGQAIGTGQLLGIRTALKSDRQGLNKKLEHSHNVPKSPALLSCEENSAAGSKTVLQWLKNSNHTTFTWMNNISINEIRQLPGFETSLRPLRANELKTAASGGPVVVINISTFRCDAVLITKDSLRLMPLSHLNYEDLKRMSANFKKTRVLNRSHRNRKEMLEVLEWLWDKITSPILEELGFGKPPIDGDVWPRIWWIPTGPLRMLPLHAAGRHSSRYSEAVIDRVISSYSPSVRALLYAQRQNSGYGHVLGEACLAAMTITPGCSPLSTAGEEVALVEKHLMALKIKKTYHLHNPRKLDLVDRLKSCDVFHFAGHGVSNPMDPSKSCLLLTDWKENPLTVESIIHSDLNGNGPFLAYLSACSTGANSSEKLYDESVNLMTACQLAGFRHVVGSLWELLKRYPLAAARQFYLALGNREAIDDDAVAWAVHAMARNLREFTRHLQDPACEQSDPFVWAAYIHIGP
ncbi:CHAT domain-containing protein [Xylaria cubensis]|nr:CHAT domain-containing protein [Xylaria cubensis]